MEKKIFSIVKKLLELDVPPLIVKEETVRNLTDNDIDIHFDTDEEFYKYFCDNDNFYPLVTSDLTMAILFIYNYYQFYLEKPHLFDNESASILKSLFVWIKNPDKYFDTNWYPDYIILDGVKYKIRYKLVLDKI